MSVGTANKPRYEQICIYNCETAVFSYAVSVDNNCAIKPVGSLPSKGSEALELKFDLTGLNDQCGYNMQRVIR